ncbi:hypothetical protein AGOR_G00017670 [Albula goreensis]|uniref:Liver-expressed antimicrobial peptide 2 n=1 Tax=Albula goreensis TaxID=1534307 RepID=A0A8T3E4P7_9TELE|nr:hypothetical protein AGOR_G00017670 [Albula goreensis]
MQVSVLFLVTLMFFNQVFCGSVVKPGDLSDALEEPRPLKRAVRMTPLWRIMGSKPHGAYCQDNYECSTRICKDGHCSFSHVAHSKK